MRSLGRRNLGALTALLLLMSACGGTSTTSSPGGSGGAAQSAEPATGGTLRIITGAAAALFDPAAEGSGLARGLMNSVLQGLTHIDPDTGEVQPLLATDWEASDDGLTWTFHLKQGVEFQDGTPFNAETVVKNVERWLDPEFQHVTRSRLQAIDTVTATDDQTVTFSLSRPYPTLPNTFGESFHYMLSQGDIDKYYLELGQHLPTGTGPFKLVEFVPREGFTMERWDGYQGDDKDQIKLDKIVVETVTDDNARTARMLSGEADLNLYQPILDIDQITSSGDVEVVSTASLRQWHFYLNANGPALSDIRVRQALNYAVDQSSLVDAVFQGFAEERHALIPKAHLGAEDVDPPYSFDADKAAQLLEDAGWTKDGDGVLRDSDGNAMTIQLAHTTGGAYVGDDDINSAVANYWRNLGIQVEESAMDSGTFYGTLAEKTAADSFDVVSVPFQIEFQDGAAFLDLTFSQRAMPPDGCCNFSFYQNEAAWAAIDEASGTVDTSARAQKIADAAALIWEDVPAVLGPQLQLVASKASNLHVDLHPNEQHSISTAWFGS